MASETTWDKIKSCKSPKPQMFPVLGAPGKSNKIGIDTAILCSCQGAFLNYYLLKSFKTTFATSELALLKFSFVTYGLTYRLTISFILRVV